MKTAIISGITGQDGAYLGRLLLDKGYRVVGLSRRYDDESIDKLKYLGIVDQVTIDKCDLMDSSSVINRITRYEPDEIYNLAAQSAVGASFHQPIGTMSFNIISVLNLLEAIRSVNPNIRFYQASSSEMFGRVEHLPVTENSVFHPLSPYATSKAAAHWSTINYREAYNLFACCGILFNHESYLRSGGFFVKKVIRRAWQIKQGEQRELRVGNIDVRRDFGYSPAYVEAMYLMLQQPQPQDFVVCSGKSVSLREIIMHVFGRLGIAEDHLVIDPILCRPCEIKDIYGDNSKARNVLGWDYNMDFFDVLDCLLEEEEKNLKRC